MCNNARFASVAFSAATQWLVSWPLVIMVI